MKVKNLLKTKKQWTKNAFARNKYGHVVDINSKSASRYCLVGAIERCYGYHTDEHQSVIKKFNKTQHEYFTLFGFNDDKSTTFEDVKTLITKLDI